MRFRNINRKYVKFIQNPIRNFNQIIILLSYEIKKKSTLYKTRVNEIPFFKVPQFIIYFLSNYQSFIARKLPFLTVTQKSSSAEDSSVQLSECYARIFLCRKTKDLSLFMRIHFRRKIFQKSFGTLR